MKTLQSRSVGSFAFAVKSDERAFQLTARALQLTATEASVFPGYIRWYKAACRGILTNHYLQGCFRGEKNLQGS